MARRSLPNTVESRAGAARRPLAASLFVSLRPHQWTKNLIIFAGLIFGYRLDEPVVVMRAVGAFAVFCVLSGVVYLLNDVVDRVADQQHPRKAQRPVASGELAPGMALGAAAVLATAGLGAAFWLGGSFGLVAVAYLALLTLYSGVLKQFVIIDVMTIAMGFVLRALAGTVVVDVPISHWLLVLTIMLALFLALTKRRHELMSLADQAVGHRASLGEYSAQLLDQMSAIVAASTLIAYSIYAISPETIAKFGTDKLGLTLPFPVYGIFRYLYLVYRRDGGGSPAEMLLTDGPLLACVGLWTVTVIAILYANALALP